MISREKLDWGWLLEASRICDEQAAQSRRRGRRRRQRCGVESDTRTEVGVGG